MRTQTLAELLLIVAVALGASTGALILKECRSFNGPAWACSVMLLAGLPMAAGAFWQRPTGASTAIALLLLLACPFVFETVDDFTWESYLLMTAGTLTFVSTAWLGTLLRSRQWIWAVLAHLGIVLGTLSIFATTWVILAFE